MQASYIPMPLRTYDDCFTVPDPVYCPVCRAECEKIYLSDDSEPVGCENCIKEQDACEWAEENEED